jgi:hypothetical protein
MFYVHSKFLQTAIKKSGIILAALGYEIYGTCALNLAMSIKAHDQDVEIILIHDNVATAHLTKEELGIFNKLKIADPIDYTLKEAEFQRIKLCVDKYTEFEGTLYLDVDNLWFPKKQISNLIDALESKDFFIGKNGQYNPKSRIRSSATYTYWEEPAKIVNYFNLKNNLPQTISGAFWFKKTEFTQKVFDRAREIYNDPAAPCMKWANGKPDEYCFNVALSELNYEQQDSHLVYFDKINGNLNRRQIYDNFWGMAIGGNKLSSALTSLYNELVDLYCLAFDFKPRYCVNKDKVISERKLN